MRQLSDKQQDERLCSEKEAAAAVRTALGNNRTIIQPMLKQISLLVLIDCWAKPFICYIYLYRFSLKMFFVV